MSVDEDCGFGAVDEGAGDWGPCSDDLAVGSAHGHCWGDVDVGEEF